ncbi:MAG: hypothetical protein ABSF69_12045 [Polyangiaceae bacterium]
MSTTQESSAARARDYRIPTKSRWTGAWRIAAAVGATGFGIAAYGYRADPDRFPFAYLFGFFVALSIALGSLFFVLVLYVTKASWGISVRRVAELFMRPMAIFAVLIIPLILTLGHLFPWAGAKQVESVSSAERSDPLAEARGIAEREPYGLRDLPLPNAGRLVRAEQQAEAHIVDHKRAYLDRRFFLGRLVAYLVIWTWLAYKYFNWSTDQDTTKALANTAAAQRFTPLGLILFAFTLTFFAFDWLLSLDATWYSTIFGVQVFAQCALVQMAALIVMTLLLRRSGLLGDTVNVEHYHDMGKLLFGWVVFWSYVSFAQFFLTWYANIPDEISWFHKRWDDNGGTWMWVSVVIVVLHFFVPFWFLLSRNTKRRLPLLAAGATCMLLMHVVEVYWIIMPNLGPLDPSLLDLGCLLGVVGVYLAAVLRGMEDYALVPVGDPRLVRALEFENA